MHFLTVSNTTSYFQRKGEASNLKTLLKGDFEGLDTALGEFGASHSDLMAVREAFVCTLYGFPIGTSVAEARHQLYVQEHGKPLKVMVLSPTHADLSIFYISIRHIMQ